MHQLKRSTDERVVARHHDLSKRLPAKAPPPVDTSNSDTGPIPIVPNPAPAAPVTPPLPPPVNPPPAAPVNPSPRPPVLPNTVPIPVPHPVTPLPLPPVSAPILTTPKPVQTTPSSAILSPSPVVTTNTPVRDISSTASATKAAEINHSPTAATSSKNSKGISSGAVGGIVAILLIVAVIVGALLVRKVYQRRRDIRRNTWGAGLVPSLENKRQTLYGGEEKSHEYPGDDVLDHKRLPSIPHSDMSRKPVPRALSVPSALASATFPPPNHVSIPASAYNTTSPISPFVPPATSVRTSQTDPASPSVPPGDLAVVARTFIPSLPDELQISNGEQIRILSAFDDGWALCVNTRGEQGVVPLECLDKRNGAPMEMQLQPFSGLGLEANRASRRMSSLAPSAKGTY